MFDAKREEVARRPLNIVEVELDRCGLTYGSSPCTAAGPVGSECYNTFGTCQDKPNFDRLLGADFDGTNDYLSRASALDTVTDSKKGTLIALLKFDDDDFTTIEALLHAKPIVSAFTVFSFSRSTFGRLLLRIANDAGVTLLQVRLAAGFESNIARGYHVFMLSWDLETGSVHAYLGDQECSDPALETTLNEAVPYETMDITTVGAFSDNGSKFNGCCPLLFFAPGDYLDFSRKVIRRRVIDDSGALLDFGITGRLVTGRQPAIYLKGGADEFATNRGYAGSFSVNGSLTTCADVPHPARTKAIVRFVESISDLPVGVDAFPALRKVSLSPTVLAPDRGLGQRSSVTVELRDFPYHDRGIDTYVGTRAFDQEQRGTFFGRLIARNRTALIGRKLRVLTGFNDDVFDVANFQERTYEIDRFEGPDAEGRMRFIAKDPLKRTDDRKAQAPFPSKGALDQDIDEVATSFGLQVPGIGDEEYPTSGFVRLGSEVMAFTRIADAMTVTRAQFNTQASSHSIGDVVQLCLYYPADRVSDIVSDLQTTYARVPAGYIPLESWDSEAAEYLTRQFTALITQPTPVDALIKELTEQAPFYLWYDERTALIQLRAIKPPSTSVPVLDDIENILDDKLDTVEKQDLRISQVWVFYGQVDPTKSLTDVNNYANLLVDTDLESEAEVQYGQASIRKIFSRWITALNKPAAQTAARSLLVRYALAPRELSFSLDAKDAELWTGDIAVVRSRAIQGIDGLPESVPMQVMEVSDSLPGHKYRYKALEFRAVPVSTERLIIVSSDYFNLHVRNAHDALYGAASGPVDVVVIVEAQAVLGSVSGSIPALVTGQFPPGSTLRLRNLGRIQGAGGQGGHAGTSDAGGNYNAGLAPGQPGEYGGDAIHVNFPLIIDVEGIIYGGGGGGGGGSAGQEGADAAGGGGGGGGVGFRRRVGPSRFGGGGGGGGSGDDGHGGPGSGATDSVPGSGGGPGDGEAGGGGSGGGFAQPGGNGGASNTVSGGTGGGAGQAIVSSQEIEWNTSGAVLGQADLRPSDYIKFYQRTISGLIGNVPLTLTRAGTATYLGEDALVKTATANIPRYFYDGAEWTGVLLEPTATNRALYGRNLEPSNLLSTDTTVGAFAVGETVNATGGGSGVILSVSAAEMLLTAGAGAFTGVLTGVTSGATANVTADVTLWVATNVDVMNDQTGRDGGTNSASSITATANNGTILQAIVDGTLRDRFLTADIKRLSGSGTLEMTLDNGATWNVVAVPATGWGRVSIPTQNLSNPTIGFRIGTSTNSFAVDYVQVEDGKEATSRIPTDAVVGTRAEDALVSSSFPNANSSEGTIAIDAYYPNNFGERNLVQIDNTTDAARHRLYVAGGGSLVGATDNSGSQAGITLGSAAVGALFRVAYSYKSNSFKTVLNSGPVLSDVSGVTPAGMSRVRFGGTLAGAASPVVIRRFRYYPRQLTDYQLQLITSYPF